MPKNTEKAREKGAEISAVPPRIYRLFTQPISPGLILGISRYDKTGKTSLPTGTAGLFPGVNSSCIPARAILQPAARYAPYFLCVIAQPAFKPAAATETPVLAALFPLLIFPKKQTLDKPPNDSKMSVSFAISCKRQRWGKGKDSSTQRESAAGVSRWGACRTGPGVACLSPWGR